MHLYDKSTVKKDFLDSLKLEKNICRLISNCCTIILRKMQKVLDKSPITYKGLRCHKFCLTTIEYSRDMCPKSPKKCQSLHKISRENLKNMWIFSKNLHFRFCKNGLKKRAALPWLSGRVLFLFWCLNSVLPQQSFIIYLAKVTSRTNVWTFLALVATFNHLKVAKSEITLHFT